MHEWLQYSLPIVHKVKGISFSSHHREKRILGRWIGEMDGWVGYRTLWLNGWSGCEIEQLFFLIPHTQKAIKLFFVYLFLFPRVFVPEFGFPSPCFPSRFRSSDETEQSMDRKEIFRDTIDFETLEQDFLFYIYTPKGQRNECGEITSDFMKFSFCADQNLGRGDYFRRGFSLGNSISELQGRFP